MENEKTVTRKYYKLSEKSQANDDLHKAFPGIRCDVSRLQGYVENFLSAAFCCVTKKKGTEELHKKLSALAKRKK